MTAETPTPSTGHSVKADTTYVVLAQKTKADPSAAQSPTPAETWQRVGSFTARSAEHAIRQHAEKQKGEDGVFVAIPARNWRPCRLAVKTVTTIDIEAA